MSDPLFDIVNDELPPLPADAPKAPPAGRYKEQHGVIAVCGSEEEQRAVYEGLRALAGAKLKVVTT
ncbi:hypothetical protein [Methylobrevis pamukkalensis]|uniref:Uncharacterized protein n=1 Tax=Methylobrevis pamukkalensis TaxID=1439726 RepID=A0A1E3H0R8_9HYPH|nr:hypothetical protein [Methylobrevis pamukkalensis]ODN69884.1 hypothetical protein A6302_02820 [Methylobrevis pamukkalensis]